MPWTGSAPNQTFTRSTGTQTGATAWQLEDAAGTKVVAAKFDTHDQDIADGLSDVIKKDGGTKPTANLPMATYRHTGVGDAAALTDYLAAGQAGKNAHDWYGGASGTDTYTLSATSFSPAAYTNGQVVRCWFTNANTVTTPSLNVNSIGAKTIVRADGSALAVGDIAALSSHTFTYNSAATQWHMQSMPDTIAGADDAVAFTGNNTHAGTETFNGAATFASTSTFNETMTINDDMVVPAVTLTDAATVAWDMTTGSHFEVTIAGNRTMGAPTVTTGQRGTLMVIQDGTGGRSLAWHARYKFNADKDALVSQGAGTKTLFSYYVYSGTIIVMSRLYVEGVTGTTTGSTAGHSSGVYSEFDLGEPVVDTNITKSHGLGALPSRVDFLLKCVTDDSATGVTAGDYIPIGHHLTTESDEGIACWFNTTTVGAAMGNALQMVSRTTHNIGAATTSNFTVIARVYE